MPVHAIQIYSSAGLAAGAASYLKREAALLVDGCPVTGNFDQLSSVNADGALLWRCGVNHSLSWQLSGRVLAREGLADWHPGAVITPATLPFLNASGELPFQMETGQGVMFYEEPTFTPGRGTLASLSVGITLAFARKRGSFTAPSGDHTNSFGVVPDPPSGGGGSGAGGGAPPSGDSWWDDAALRLLSIYFYPAGGGVVARLPRVALRAVTYAEVLSYWNMIRSADADYWETAENVEQLPVMPPQPDSFTGPFASGESAPLLLGVYDHRAAAWLGSAPAVATPAEGDVLPRWVWFGPLAEVGPFLYLGAPGAHRPAAAAGLDIAAQWEWTSDTASGWVDGVEYAGAGGWLGWGQMARWVIG